MTALVQADRGGLREIRVDLWRHSSHVPTEILQMQPSHGSGPMEDLSAMEGPRYAGPHEEMAAIAKCPGLGSTTFRIVVLRRLRSPAEPIPQAHPCLVEVGPYRIDRDPHRIRDLRVLETLELQ